MGGINSVLHLQIGEKRKTKGTVWCSMFEHMGYVHRVSGFLHKGCGVINHTVSALVVAGREFAEGVGTWVER